MTNDIGGALLLCLGAARLQAGRQVRAAGQVVHNGPRRPYSSCGRLMQGASAVRFSGWFCLVLGVAFLFAAGVLGVLAIHQATEISAYHHARSCQADAPSDVGCLLAVDGSVAAVTDFPGVAG